MKVLLLGSGGREHAMAWKIAQSPLLTKLFWAPGNAAGDRMGINIGLDPMDFNAVENFCRENHIDLLVVGPEAPLVAGIRDHFENTGSCPDMTIVGPDSKGAQLEGSKSFAKIFMKKYRIPTASYREFTADQQHEAIGYLENATPPYVIKADGLAAGKGVVIVNDQREAMEEVRQMLAGKFGDASKKLVIESFLDGIEFSVFALTDGKNYLILPEAKDYKRIGEGDTGPNTGGMGAVSPVPFFDTTMREKVISRVVEPTIRGLQEEGIDYRGFIFFGLISVKGEPYVIEYNCRMGDPETEVVMPRIQNDLLPLLAALGDQTLDRHEVAFSPEACTTVMMVSGGYPEKYEKHKPISGLDKAENSAIPFHAGTLTANSGIVTNGGRVIALTGLGKDMHEALRHSYEAAEAVDFENKYFRRDIGKDLQ